MGRLDLPDKVRDEDRDEYDESSLKKSARISGGLHAADSRQLCSGWPFPSASTAGGTGLGRSAGITAGSHRDRAGRTS